MLVNFSQLLGRFKHLSWHNRPPLLRFVYQILHLLNIVKKVSEQNPQFQSSSHLRLFASRLT
jgi:hypothetical protein